MNRGGMVGLFFAQLFGFMFYRASNSTVNTLYYACYKDVLRRKYRLVPGNKRVESILILPYGWGIVPRWSVHLLRLLGLVDTRPLLGVKPDGTKVYSYSDPSYHDEVSMLNLPLPLIHRDFTFSNRFLEVSRLSGTPLNV